jgi:hypothetical protein
MRRNADDRYIATVENVDGEYWISLPGIDKADAIAKRPEDIVPNARIFLDNKIQAGASARTFFGDDMLCLARGRYNLSIRSLVGLPGNRIDA